MRSYLHIGEIADLLGITPKTIRHYHKVGLLAEPERSEGGYRCYEAEDLVRLLRIRRLQALGMSLRQVRGILGAPDGERSLRRVLQDVAAEIDGQIAALQARRAHLQALLADEALDVAEQPAEPSQILAWAREHLAAQGIAVSAELWQQDVRLFGLLEGLQWPGSLRDDLSAAESALLGDPERYRALLRIAEGLVALAQVAEDDPAVAALAAEVAASPELSAFITGLDAAGSAGGRAPMPDPFGAILTDVLLSALSPAQRRCLELVRAARKEAR